MNNFHDNLPFGLSYADLSQAQALDNAVLHSSPLQEQALQHVHPQNPTAYDSISSSYAAFPMLQAATMQPPQLHQHQTTSSKDGSNFTTLSKLGKAQRDLPQESTPSPVRVTRPPNAFLLFNKEMRKELKRSNPTMKVGEISKEIGERWKKLSDAEKGRYLTEANNIKETQRALHPNSMYIRRSKAELTKAGHYARLRRKALEQQQALEAKNNSLSNSVKGNLLGDNTGDGSDATSSNHEASTSTPKRRKRHKRDKNPAAPKHPLSAYMWFLTEVRPETMQTYPGSTVGQISKLCAERWKAMTEAERLPWHTKAQADKARYAREMQIYASQHDQPMGRGTRLKYRAAAAAAAATGSSATSTEETGLPPSSIPGVDAAVHLSPNHSDLLLADTQPTSIPSAYHGDEHNHHSLSVPSSPTSLLHSSPLSPSSADVAAIFGTRRE